MLIASRLIFRQIAALCLSLTFVLLCCMWLVHSMRIVELILKSSESFFTFFKLMLLTVPDLLVIVLPIATLISVIFVYNRLQNDRELVAMTACGYSNWTLSWPSILFAIFVSGFIYFINIFVLHESFREVRDVEHKLKNSLPNLIITPGVFNPMGDSMVYVRRKLGKNNLIGITAYVDKKNGAPYTIIAKEGKLVTKNDVPHILMKDGNRQVYDNVKRKLSIVYFDETLVSITGPERSNIERARKPYEFSISELADKGNEAENTPQKLRFYVELAQRLISPLYPIAYAILALIFIMGSAYTRNGKITTVVYIILSAITLQVACLGLINMGTKSIEALFGAIAIMLGTIIIGGAYLYLNSTGKKKI